MKMWRAYLALAVALLAGVGCAAHRPLAWRLEPQTLIPPATSKPVAIKTRGECPSADAIVARRKGGRVVFDVDREALAKQPAGWLADWSRQVEEKGCVAEGEGLTLAGRVLESGPLGLSTGFRLLHPSSGRSGYVDLGAGSRLEVITPVMEAATADSSRDIAPPKVTEIPGGLQVEMNAPPGLLRVEKNWYAVREGSITPMDKTELPNLFADVHARFWRLIYKSDQSTILVGADSLREMESATTAINTGSGPCAKCIAVPRSVGLNPFQAVMVNGREVRVSLGSTLRAVIRAAGKTPEEVAPSLAISKQFGGRMLPVLFEHTKPYVLDMVMEGNELVSW